ncbi:TSUP family transporter [Bradyrhizobium sp. NAS80.1]|uniref:TSUP family transporter n=1 Tax=Bradyrhizobium sp. NAS80.1 TaxID=1680159 RepID=UPI0009FFBC69
MTFELCHICYVVAASEHGSILGAARALNARGSAVKRRCATGVFVIPAVPCLGSLGLERDDLVQALGLSFNVSTLPLAAGLTWHGALPTGVAGASLLALVPALAGMLFGGWLCARVSPETFRVIFFAGLLLLGGELFSRGLA